MAGTRKAPFYISLAAGMLIVLAGLYGFSLLRGRPGLPAGIEPGDIIRIDGQEVRARSDLELALAGRAIGERLTVEVRRGTDVETMGVELIPFYSRVPFPVIYLVIGLLCSLVAFIVLLFRWEDPRARILYWLASAFSLCVMVNGGTYCLRDHWTTYLPMLMFYLFYPLTAALLFHFSLTFQDGPHRRLPALAYGVSLLFGGAFTTLILLALKRRSFPIFRVYAGLFNIFFRAYLVALLLLTILFFIRAFRRASLQERRAQIKWIFLGLALGLAPFIFLYQLPRLLGRSPLLGEDAVAVFFIFIPLGLALAILRFRFLNVEIVINRSLVYSLLTVLTAGIYMLSVTVFRDLAERLLAAGDTAVSIGSALLAAIAFEPARRRIQSWVDVSFFRKSYDYRRTVRAFDNAARGALDPTELVALLADRVREVLPVERLSVVIGTLTADGWRRLYPPNGEEEDGWAFLPHLPAGGVCARRASVGTEEGVDFSREEALRTGEWELAVDLPFKAPALKGGLFLGGKRSGRTFTGEDIELLRTLAAAFSLNLERLRLQEEVLCERAAKEKLDELNRLKTEFVASVSHELRTPLTSIQALSEILEAGRVTDSGARKEIHHTLAAESARLSRLLRNILDFGKIERQTKTYDFRAEDISRLIVDLARVFRPQLEEGGFVLDLNLPPRPVVAEVDRDAVEQLLVNLLDNAMKYSGRRKRLGIDLLENPGTVEIRIRDEGIGIPPEEAGQIFGHFFRGAGAARVNPKGVGLGLKIVRHIVEAHRGEILVDSHPSEGTTFRVILPRSRAS